MAIIQKFKSEEDAREALAKPTFVRNEITVSYRCLDCGTNFSTGETSETCNHPNSEMIGYNGRGYVACL